MDMLTGETLSVIEYAASRIPLIPWSYESKQRSYNPDEIYHRAGK